MSNEKPKPASTTKPKIQRVHVSLIDGADRTKAKAFTVYGKTIPQLLADWNITK
tara:strand:- start:249 stop:410 length:162 start_codon:yes stop_codon:yes gene_type:complete